MNTKRHVWESSMRQPIPELQDYDIQQIIGIGGQSRVFRATCKRTDRVVALKVLKNEGDAGRRFQRELQIMSTIRLSGVLQMLDHGRDGEFLYHATPVMAGTLVAHIRRPQGLPFPAMLRITLQLANTLAQLHRHGVVHRDLKPSNIFTTRRLRIVIGDFGLSRREEDTDVTLPGTRVGTRPYLSPEVILGEGAGAPSDAYSLGVILYELFTGHAPYEKGLTGSRLEREIVDGRIIPLLDRAPAIPWQIASWIHRLLDRDPASRPDACRTFSFFAQVWSRYSHWCRNRDTASDGGGSSRLQGELPCD